MDLSTSSRVIALMYHDVGADSGFPGSDADLYKLAPETFRAHLDAIAQHTGAPPLILTFDDGGASAYTSIADELERCGWRGHFFVTTDYIGRRRFLSAEQIRALRARGHLIGSHSCSHPQRISHCAWEEILREWSESVRVLSDILGEAVIIASVPGGFYSREVARAAAQAGIRVLFTSEPTVKPRRVHGCLVLGRYFVQRDTPPEIAAAFAAGHRLPRLQQAALWQLKKAAKATGGAAWFRFRARLLARYH